MDLNLGFIIEILAIGVTAGGTVGLLFHAKSKALHDRITKAEDKITELSIACLRREEFNHGIEILRSDIADVRRRVDDMK